MCQVVDTSNVPDEFLDAIESECWQTEDPFDNLETDLAELLGSIVSAPVRDACHGLCSRSKTGSGSRFREVCFSLAQTS